MVAKSPNNTQILDNIASEVQFVFYSAGVHIKNRSFGRPFISTELGDESSPEHNSTQEPPHITCHHYNWSAGGKTSNISFADSMYSSR